MNWQVCTYLVYLIISVALTVWVARTLHRNGRIFLVDSFLGNEPLADSVNRLLVVGFYLINLGWIISSLRMYGALDDPRLLTSRHIVFNLSRPEKSLLLLAPLAPAAGGWGLCHDPKTTNSVTVFADTADAGYQKLLAMIRAEHRGPSWKQSKSHRAIASRGSSRGTGSLPSATAPPSPATRPWPACAGSSRRA